MRTLTAQQLKEWKTSNRDMALINVLDSEYFDAEHIPGSINIPVSREGFENLVQLAVNTKDDTIVVYCAGPKCDASPKAARRLSRAGFRNVYDFEGGMKGWKAAGYQVVKPEMADA